VSPPARLLLAFDSIHDVLRAERALQAAGLTCELVPTPRALTSDCGMSLSCRPEERQAISALDAREGLGVRRTLEL